MIVLYCEGKRAIKHKMKGRNKLCCLWNERVLAGLGKKFLRNRLVAAWQRSLAKDGGLCGIVLGRE
jgi:hypothetical protein